MSPETIENTYKVAAPARLVISNIRGSIEITPGPDNEVHASASKYNETGDANRTEIVMSQDADGTVRIETRYRHEGRLSFGDRPCKVDYRVSVPKDCSVDCQGVSSSALMHGLHGDFNISTVSGGVQIKDLSGPVRINAVSGEITGDAISGALNYETVSGELRLMDSNFTKVNGSSVSGSVWLQTSLMGGPYTFNTVSGSVYLLVPPGSACIVESQTMSGSLVTDLPVSQETKRLRHQRSVINGGGTAVLFNGVSGNISVLAGEGGQPQPAAEPAPTDSINSNAILDKIERGEITVNEGILLLKNLH